jgi:hypothetical protein
MVVAGMEEAGMVKAGMAVGGTADTATTTDLASRVQSSGWVLPL